ncbi:hypothetical protein [Isoptericola croceus]|uniref:hypothetical protein n=1 Tax=Isoptericola croceus TaxID=3031406 RepID=UPI0023F891A7|nr:hypothetical protein [Isoptericola croceus]
MLLPTTDVAVAAAHLRAARAALDDATALLRRAAGLDWDSPAGDLCRDTVGDLLQALATDAATLTQAVLVAEACEVP